MEPRKNIKVEVNVEDMTSRNVSEKKNVQNMSRETPSVLNKSFFVGANSSPINVTDFLHSAPGQKLYILGDGNMTIVNGVLVFTNTGANKLFVMNKRSRLSSFLTDGPLFS